jgi:NitT/TauT family transport system permease protein
MTVARRLFKLLTAGRFNMHLAATLLPTLGGFAIAAALGTVAGYAAAKRGWLRDLLWPYAVALQAVPVVALVPLLFIWLGPGFATRLVISAVIAVFPTFVAALAAFRAVPADLRAVFGTLAATRRQAFLKLELPAALPGLFDGWRLSLSFALIGTVVAEFIAGNRGLGYLVNFGRGVLDTPLAFAAILTLVALGLALQATLTLIEKLSLRLR